MSARHFFLGTLLFAYLLGLSLLAERIRPRGEFFEFTQRIQQQGTKSFLNERWGVK
jgi:hypothetical protein